MLVLSRKTGERILIGDRITLTVVRIGPNNVRIGIECPRDVPIVREELTAVPGAAIPTPLGDLMERTCHGNR